MPHPRTKAKTRKRSPSWIGTRVTVCGYRLHTEDDLICVLPPHTEAARHTSIALTDDDPPKPVMVIEYEDHITLVESPQTHG